MISSKKYIYNIPDDPNHAASKVFAWIDYKQDVLEIGCASGIQTKHLKEHFDCRITGLEIDPLAAEDARPYCESVIVGSIEELDLHAVLGERLYDAVTFVDVLEHLRDPVSALKKVRPFIKQDGCLIASIPNIAHAVICLELAHGRFDYQNYGLLDNTHIRFFTRKNVEKVFEDAGYQIDVWERVVKYPQDTEFRFVCGSAREQAFLDWICEQNSEAHTYQFIVKASPSALDKKAMSYQQLEARDSQQKLEAKIDMLTMQNQALASELEKSKSQVTWLENRRFGVLSGMVNKFLGSK